MAASYPASLKSFSAKADGNTVFAAHVNELQEEVAALQSTLGTLPAGGSATVKDRIAAVESGKASTSHTHDHGTLTGLSDDDHPQYMLRNIGTTKGDILVYNGTSWVRQGVGTDGQVLRADSAQADGILWATPLAGDTFVRALANATTANYTATDTTYITLAFTIPATWAGWVLDVWGYSRNTHTSASSSQRVHTSVRLNGSAISLHVDTLYNIAGAFTNTTFTAGTTTQTGTGAQTVTITAELDALPSSGTFRFDAMSARCMAWRTA